VAFFLEYLDNTIKIPDEVERYLKIPLLGLVGLFRLIRTATKTKKLSLMLRPPVNNLGGLRTIRTNLLFFFSG
jgi:hypothetical protein